MLPFGPGNMSPKEPFVPVSPLDPFGPRVGTKIARKV